MFLKLVFPDVRNVKVVCSIVFDDLIQDGHVRDPDAIQFVCGASQPCILDVLDEAAHVFGAFEFPSSGLQRAKETKVQDVCVWRVGWLLSHMELAATICRRSHKEGRVIRAEMGVWIVVLKANVLD